MLEEVAPKMTRPKIEESVTDSQAALKPYTFESKLILCCNNSEGNSQKKKHFIVMFVPDHEIIKKNEEADIITLSLIRKLSVDSQKARLKRNFYYAN